MESVRSEISTTAATVSSLPPLLPSLLVGLFLLSTISSIGVVAQAAQTDDGEDDPADLADSPETESGAVVAAFVMELEGQSGNNSEAVFAPHIVELFTATWCIPCRTAEQEVGELEVWWPAVLVLAQHSSTNSPDELATEQSAGLKDYYGIGGYPTLLIDGHWTLLGEEQSKDLQSLLTNLSDAGLVVSSPEFSLNWSRTGSTISADWSYVGGGNYSLDLLVVQDEVKWPNTIMAIDEIVTGGVTNRSMNGSAEFEISSAGSNTRLVAIIRVTGEPVTRTGSDTPVFGSLPNSWTPPPEVRSISGKAVFGITVVLVIVALVPMRHTLPVLWRKSGPPAAKIEEE